MDAQPFFLLHCRGTWRPGWNDQKQKVDAMLLYLYGQTIESTILLFTESLKLYTITVMIICSHQCVEKFDIGHMSHI